MSNEDNDRTTISATHLEPNPCNAPLGAQEAEGHHPPVSIHVHSVRKRLTDSDGISAKAAIDGLVLANILPDDSPKYVRQVSYSQEKGATEKTIITIEE